MSTGCCQSGSTRTIIRQAGLLAMQACLLVPSSLLAIELSASQEPLSISGTPVRLDEVLSYSAVDNFRLPTNPLPATQLPTEQVVTAESIISSAAPQSHDITPELEMPSTASRSKLNWQQPGVAGKSSEPAPLRVASKPVDGTTQSETTQEEAFDSEQGPSLMPALNSAEVSGEQATQLNANESEPAELSFAGEVLAEDHDTSFVDDSEEQQPAELDDEIASGTAVVIADDTELEEPALTEPELSELELSEPRPMEMAQIEATPLAVKTKPTYEARIAPQSGVVPPKDPAKPLNRGMMNLRSRMRTVLSYYYNKPLNSVENDPWEVMHSMLSFELHSRVLEGGARGKPITAVGHLCFNRPTERKKMMYINENGELDVRVGVGLQGHKGQFLSMLAQCNVSPDYPIRVEGKEFTIRDLIRAEQRTCYAKTELTFKLIGLGHYLASDATWLNDQGEVWDFPRLIKDERTQKIRGAACGGTHRLAGLSLAYRRREARGEPLDGEYLEAAKFVSEYQSYAFKLQNSDGSLSTEWFRGRGAEEDIERRIRTTGHLVEWLTYSLPDEQLTSRPMVRAVSYLTNLLATYSKQDWHKGSIAHAQHALVLYDKRVFQPHDNAEQASIAINPSANRYRGYSIYRGVLRYQEAPHESGGFFGLFGPTRSTKRPSSGHTR